MMFYIFLAIKKFCTLPQVAPVQNLFFFFEKKSPLSKAFAGEQGK